MAIAQILGDVIYYVRIKWMIIFIKNIDFDRLAVILYRKVVIIR
jgi:hypothetical protein